MPLLHITMLTPTLLSPPYRLRAMVASFTVSPHNGGVFYRLRTMVASLPSRRDGGLFYRLHATVASLLFPRDRGLFTISARPWPDATAYRRVCVNLTYIHA